MTQTFQPIAVQAAVDPNGHGRLVAARTFQPGEIILHMEGFIDPEPSSHSVQIGPDEHLRPAETGTAQWALWRYMNHSCSPSAAVRGREVVALRQLGPGEEITFDYCTTEASLTCPFACGCGSVDCRQWIGGFRHLLPAQRAHLLPHVAPHLEALAHAAEPLSAGRPPGSSG